jgi:hypothetical protein
VLTRLDARTLEILAELEASRFGDVLKKVLSAERERLREDLEEVDPSRVQRLQGKAQQLTELLDLLATAQKQVRR